MNRDLRGFLEQIEALGPDYYARVSKPVDPLYEPCVIQEKLAAAGRYPVLHFEHVNGSSLPLVFNLFGSYEMLGLALASIRANRKARFWRPFVDESKSRFRSRPSRPPRRR